MSPTARPSYFRREFGDDYFAFTVGGCRGLVLNTQLHNALEEKRWTDPAHRYIHVTNEEKAEACELAQEQNSWLEAECRGITERPPAAHVLCFSHIPPFVRAPDEPNGYYNLEPEVRRSLLNQVKAAGCTKWFCGHYHQNAGGYDGSLEIVVTGAVGCQIPLRAGVPPESPAALSPGGQDFSATQCGLEVSGLRLVTVTREAVYHKWYTFAQLNAMEAETKAPKPLKKPKFMKVSGIQPEAKGVNVMVKCVKGPAVVEGSVSFKNMVVGDETGIVTVRLRAEADAQLSVCTPGTSLRVQNGTVRMVKGHVCLVIDKWAVLKLADKTLEFEVLVSKDVSGVEYEHA